MAFNLHIFLIAVLFLVVQRQHVSCNYFDEKLNQDANDNQQRELDQHDESFWNQLRSVHNLIHFFLGPSRESKLIVTQVIRISQKCIECSCFLITNKPDFKSFSKQILSTLEANVFSHRISFSL